MWRFTDDDDDDDDDDNDADADMRWFNVYWRAGYTLAAHSTGVETDIPEKTKKTAGIRGVISGGWKVE